MKRFHVHVSVGDLNQSIQFYTELFGSEPSALKSDYARWMLDDPRVNFAISQRGAALGVQHLGIQAEDRAELEEVYGHDPVRTELVKAQEVACCAPKCCSSEAA